jgi:hypothetical protein
MPLDENEAWERMQAAILRYQADPTDENHAEVRRTSRAFREVFCGNVVPLDAGKAAA